MALKGTPAVNDLTFESFSNPTINNRDEVGLAAMFKDASGKTRMGILQMGGEDTLMPLALPDQPLCDGGKIQGARNPVLNDHGDVAFRAVRQGDQAPSAYLWQKGEIRPVAPVGMALPGEGVIGSVTAARISSANQDVLVAVHPRSSPNQAGLYRFRDNQLVPQAVPGQEMPGGGKLRSIALTAYGTTPAWAQYNISYANRQGQYAFLARLEGGGSGGYRLDPDGKLSLILKSGATTDLGKVSSIPDGFGIGLNGRGQVAVTVDIAGRGT